MLSHSAQNDRQKNRLSRFLCHPERSAKGAQPKDPFLPNSIRRTEEVQIDLALSLPEQGKTYRQITTKTGA